MASKINKGEILAKFFDDGEYTALFADGAVSAACGYAAGQQAYAVYQNGEAVTVKDVEKNIKVLEMAAQTGCPVVTFYNSVGAKLAEGLDVLTASAKLNATIAKVSGVIPQIAVVTGVCGGTAIAAISPVIGAEEEDTAYAMTAIFLFDMLACLGYPYFAMLIGMSSEQFGFLAGSAVNDTSSVVAAQETYAALNGLQDYALPTTIKVVRTTMIIVLTLIFSAVTARRRAREGAAALAGGRGASFWGALPKFIPVFLLMIVANTLLANLVAGAELYEEALQPLFSQAYKFMVTVALSAIGFKISFRELFTKGLRPIALGGCTWFAVFLSSLAFSLAFA